MKGTCLKGRYLLGEVIGKGGMAVVYTAYDFRTGQMCIRDREASPMMA